MLYKGQNVFVLCNVNKKTHWKVRTIVVIAMSSICLRALGERKLLCKVQNCDIIDFSKQCVPLEQGNYQLSVLVVQLCNYASLLVKRSIPCCYNL